MNDSQVSQSTGKMLGLVIVVAIVTAAVVTLVQYLLLGKSNVAITGGVVGGIAGALAVVMMRKKPA